MNLDKFTGPGSTPSRRAFWDKVADAVTASQKQEGRNASVDEHQGLGTVINFPDQTPSEVISDICCDGNVCTHLPFSPECQHICGIYIIEAPCSECENNFCPPHDSEVTAVIDGLTDCGCIDGGGGGSFHYSFDLDGTYNMGTMSEASPCVWQLSFPGAVTYTAYSDSSDCSTDPFVTINYDLIFGFSCGSLYPETGVHIFGRITEETAAFDLFSHGEDFLDPQPWALANDITFCGMAWTPTARGCCGTITFTW